MSKLCDALAPFLVKVREVPSLTDPFERWDKMKITDRDLRLMVKPERSEPDMYGNVQVEMFTEARFKELVPGATARKKINFNEENAKNSALKDFENQRGVNLAWTIINDTIASTSDIARNRGIDPIQLRDGLTGNIGVSYINVAQILGRQYLNSVNVRLMKNTPHEIAKQEAELGKALLEPLIQEGYIHLNDTGHVPYNGQRDSTLEYKKVPRKLIVAKTISFNPEKLKDLDIRATDSHARAVSKMLNPTREILPTHEPIEVDVANSLAHDIRITNNMRETFSLLGQGKKHIHPLFGGFFKSLGSMDKNDMSTFEYLKSLGKMYPNDFLYELIGNELPDIKMFSIEDSQKGIARTKVDNLVNIADNLNHFFDEEGNPQPVYFDYFAFKTSRSLATQNILNPQTDKHLSRAVLSSEPVEVEVNSPAFKKVLGALYDDYGVKSINEIYDANTKQLNMDVFANAHDYASLVLDSPEMKSFKDNFLNKDGTFKDSWGMEELFQFYNNKPTYVTKGDSVFDRIKGTAMLYDLLTSIVNEPDNPNPSITISHHIAPDASGSGLLLNLLQSIHDDNPNVKDILTKLGFMADTNGMFLAEYDSLYEYISKELEEDVKKERKPEDVKGFVEDFHFLNELDPSFNARNLAKMPTMTMGAYGQSEFNAMRNISNSLAKEVLTTIQLVKDNEHRAELIRKLEDIIDESLTRDSNNSFGITKQNLTKHSPDIDLGTILNHSGLVQLLSNHFSRDGGISDVLTTKAESKIAKGLYGREQSHINSIYSQIEQFTKANDIPAEKVKIIPPQVMFDLGLSMDTLRQMDVVELAKLTQKWGLPLTKRVEVLHEDGTTTNHEVLNRPSFNVSTTHMKDAAIQHLSLHNSIKEYQATYGSVPAVDPIHDSNSSNPLFAEIQDQNYTQAVFEVSKEWNRLQMLIIAAKSLGISENNSTIKSIQEQVDKLEPSRVANIKEIIQNLDNSQYVGKSKVYGFRHTTKMNPFNLNEYLNIQEVTNFSPDQLKKYKEIKDFLKKNPNVNVNLDSDLFEYAANRDDTTGKVFEIIQAINLKNNTHPDLATAAKLNYLHHEIEHANTHTFIMNATANKTEDVKYVDYLNQVLDNMGTYHMEGENGKLYKAIDKLYGNDNSLTHMDPSGKPMTTKDYVTDRFQYIMESQLNHHFSNNTNKGVIEFVAIMNAEPDFAAAFMKVMRELQPENNKNDIKSASRFSTILRRLLNRIKAWVFSQEDMSKVNSTYQKDGVDTGYNNIDATTALLTAIKLKDLGIEDRYEPGFETERLRMTNVPLGAMDTSTDNTQKQNQEEGFKDKKSARELAFEYRLYEGDNSMSDPFSAGSAVANQYARVAISLTLGQFGKNVYDSYITTKHNQFMKSSPIYREVMQLLQDARKNAHVQQILHYMNVDNFKDSLAKTQLLSKFNDSVRERNKLDNSYVRDLSDKLEAAYTQEEIAKINTVYSKTGIFALTHDSTILLDLIANDPKVTNDDVFLDNYIKDYIATNKISATEAGKARGLAKIYVYNTVDGSITTDNIRAYAHSKDRAYKLETLASLYAMKETKGIDTIRNVVDKTPEIHQEMVHVATGIKAVLSKLEKRLGSTEAPISANIVGDVYKNNYQIIAVDMQTFNKGTYSEDWKVLRHPKPGKLGLVYRPNINTRQTGLGTDNNFSVDGLVLDSYKTSKYTNLLDNNAVSIYMGKEKATKILFTNEEKATLGLVENPAHSLYRTYAHLLFLLDTQEIRDKLVTEAFTKTIVNKALDIESLQQEINNPDQEHSWFLNITSNVSFNDLPKSVKELYQPVEHMTNLGQMASKITHVRKDIAPWLVGYSEPELVAKNYKLNRVANVFKKLAAMQKIKWVIVNPPKIMFDAISNTTYLISRNVDIPRILKYGKQITEALPQLNELRNNIVAAKLFANADPLNKAKQDKVKEAEKALNNHPFAFIFRNGYVSSISTDLIMKENATVTGLENDIENFLNKIVRDNKGDLNSIGKFVMKVGKAGVSTEDALNIVGNLLGKQKTTKTVGNALNNIASELTRIKDKDDAAKYLMQFMAAPGSEAVKLGSLAVQGIDIISKGILHMHLKDIGKTEAEAIADVTESFFDYTANMPESMKILSDYMVLLFPTFWARVQRALYRLGTEQPVSLASALVMTEMIGLDNTHYLGSNIVSKFSNGSILNAPGITADAFIPTKFYPFIF